MQDVAESEHLGSSEGGEDPAAMERRIFRGMWATVALAVPVSAALAPWRVTTGLLLGGLLSLLNHHWLRTSVGSFFRSAAPGTRPRLKVARYVLRYLVAASVVAVAYRLDLVSLVATLAGMCTFVPAALLEGLIQLYGALFRREET
jgi:hypothetical protein